MRSGMLRSPSAVMDRTCFSMAGPLSVPARASTIVRRCGAQRRQQTDREAQYDDRNRTHEPDFAVNRDR